MNRRDGRIKPRDYLYASEIGRNMLDVYWAMSGIEPTNLASDVARRKMEAGNFYEAVVVWVMRRTGILKDTQTRVKLLDQPDMLNVSGKLDFIAGHDGNWKKTIDEVESYFKILEDMNFDFPYFDSVKKISRETMKVLSEKYPNGLEDKIYEVKSINSMAFWRGGHPIEEPYFHHVRQLTFYQNYSPIKIGSFIYIDRDTMSISEIPNYIKDDVINDMHNWIKKMTYYYRNNIEPPRPEIILFDEKEQKYQFNWEIDRSQYRDKILGDTDVEKVLEEIKAKNKQLRLNRTIEDSFKEETIRGTKKYKIAIGLLRAREDDEVVMKKSKCTQEDVDLLKARIEKDIL